MAIPLDPLAIWLGNMTSSHQPDPSQIVRWAQYIQRLLEEGVNVLPAVDLATTANITLSGEQTIDGTLTSTSRVLVKDQTSTAQNGIYVTASGAWSRAADASTAAELSAIIVAVLGGTQAGTVWRTGVVEPSGPVIWAPGATEAMVAAITDYLDDGLSAKLTSSANLSDVASAATARTNIGAAAQADLNTALAAIAARAPLDSAVLTGTPNAPTPAAGNNTTRIATTEYVVTAVATKADAAALAEKADLIDLQERLPLRALAADYARAVPGTASWYDRRRALDLIDAVSPLQSGLILGLSSDGARIIEGGLLAQAYDFSGAEDHATTPDVYRPDVGSDGRWIFDGTSFLYFAATVLRETTFSADVVFQIDGDVSADGTILSRGPATSAVRGWRLYFALTQQAVRFEYRTGVGTIGTGFVRIPLGVPVRATVTFESGVGASIYIAGALVASVASAEALQPATPDTRRTYIGGHDSASGLMKGAVWRALVWDRILSAEEIGSLEPTLEPETAVPAALQPQDFRLDGVLDNSGIPDWIPAAARPSLIASGGVVYDGNGVHLDDGRQLHHFLPRATDSFGFGFGLRPKLSRADMATAGDNLALAELHGEAPSSGVISRRARIRVLTGGAMSVLFEGYSDGIDLVSKNHFDWQADDELQFYIQSDGNLLHIWARSYRPLDGQKIDVWTTETPSDWRIARISLGGGGGALGSANSVYERVQIAHPAYHRSGPDEFFSERVTGDPVFCINFDDGFFSDYQAAQILENYGARGTFFIIGQQANSGTGDGTGARRMNWTQIKDLHARGHDIQCHSFRHQYEATLTEAELRAEFEDNDAAFAAQGLPRPRIHAYPYNSYNQQVRNICLEYRDMARSVTIGLDSYAPNHGAMRTLRLDGNNGQEPFPGVLFNAANMHHFIDQLCRNGGIGSVLFHEIEGPGSAEFDPATFEYFEEIVEYATRRLKVRTFADILRELGPREMRGAYLD